MRQHNRKKMVPKVGNRVINTPQLPLFGILSPSEDHAKQTGHICRGLRADP